MDAIISAAQSISPGLQFPNQVNLDNTYGRTCHMEIHNGTRFALSDPQIRAVGGRVAVPPTLIAPGQLGPVVTHKRYMSLYGSFGVVSWLIREKNCRFVLFWDNPSDHIFRSNWLVGLGIADQTQPSPNLYKTYTKMNQSWFKRQRFNDNDSTLVYQNNDFTVHGTMSSSPNTVVKVLVLPNDNDDFAPRVKAALEM